MKDIFLRKEILKRPGPLKKHYDVVIVGGGSHGLATAYYLAIHHGITDVAILEKSYIGSGAAGPQHDDHPRELPHPGGRRVLQGERQALREALGRPRLQHDVLAARPLHARALRPLARRAERARRGEQAARHRQPRDRPPRGEEALPADPHRRGRDVADPGRALPPARRHHPPRRRRVGLRQAGGAARRRDPPGRRGDRVRRQGRPDPGRQDEPGRHLDERRPQRHRRLVDARSPRSPACRSRSPARSCRRS